MPTKSPINLSPTTLAKGPQLAASILRRIQTYSKPTNHPNLGPAPRPSRRCFSSRRRRSQKKLGRTFICNTFGLEGTVIDQIHIRTGSCLGCVHQSQRLHRRLISNMADTDPRISKTDRGIDKVTEAFKDMKSHLPSSSNPDDTVPQSGKK